MLLILRVTALSEELKILGLILSETILFLTPLKNPSRKKLLNNLRVSLIPF